MQAFETKEKDLLSRIGKLRTKTCVVETPLLFPVISPVSQLISPRKIKEVFGFDALITNAYIMKQRFKNQPTGNGLHKLLDYDGAVMTDSGAYQILVYGDVQTSPEEIVRYQEQIGSDIATILDIPTGWKVSEEDAQKTVKETLNRAKQFFKVKTRDDILWVGPVQGGKYLSLVAYSAKEMSKLPFQIHALGSPTEVMERYRFDVLVDMIMTAKMNLPPDRPLHLFGAGHPFMFSLAVALGCDLFDSAAYALYAKEDRYMTETGTARLNELEYFPCTCSKCTKTTPKQVIELPAKEKEAFLAEHNLYVCAAEIRRIKQAIKDGRLWELVQQRAHSHPALYTAFRKLKQYEDFIEKHSPAVKNSGLFYFNHNDLVRPEIVHYRRTLKERYARPKQAKTLLLFPQTRSKPFGKSMEYKQIRKALRKHADTVHTCFYAAPFGVIPIELDEVYPLSQHETATPLDNETIQYVTSQVADYINRTNYKKIMLLNDSQNWGRTIQSAARRICKQKNMTIKVLSNTRSLQIALKSSI